MDALLAILSIITAVTELGLVSARAAGTQSTGIVSCFHEPASSKTPSCDEAGEGQIAEYLLDLLGRTKASYVDYAQASSVVVA